MNDKLLRVAEVASLLGLKEGTVRDWIYAERLPHVKLGRAVRVPERAVEDLVRRSTVPAREEDR